MTKEQANLLRGVLHDSVTSWNTNVTFPATLEQMIDAKIEYCEEQASHLGKPRDEKYKAQITALQELKTIMEGK